MIAGLLARKLVMYVAYSAAVTALPVLANLPATRVPLLHASCDGEACRCEGCCEPCECHAAPPVAQATATTSAQIEYDTSQPQERWWCRGPVRRSVRAAALFVTRPWRR